MLKKLFTEHTASIGETYWEHLGRATFFSARMLAGGLACLTHGFLPFLFVNTGSNTIKALHERMAVRRQAASDRPARAVH